MVENKDKRYFVGEVPTETQKVIVDNENKDKEGNPQTHDIYSILAEIKNDIEEIKKTLGK